MTVYYKAYVSHLAVLLCIYWDMMHTLQEVTFHLLPLGPSCLIYIYISCFWFFPSYNQKIHFLNYDVKCSERLMIELIVIYDYCCGARRHWERTACATIVIYWWTLKVSHYAKCTFPWFSHIIMLTVSTETPWNVCRCVLLLFHWMSLQMSCFCVVMAYSDTLATPPGSLGPSYLYPRR